MGRLPQRGDGRQRPIKDLEREKFRRQLLGHYRKEKRYQNIILQDLQPLWAEVQTINPYGHGPLADRLRANPAVERFEEMIEQTVKNTMRLTLNNCAVDWAQSAVRADVWGRDVAQPSLTLTVEAMNLRLEAAPDGVSLTFNALGPPFHETRFFASEGPDAFNDWRVVAREARALIDDWLKSQNERWKDDSALVAHNASYGGIPTDELRREEIAALFGYLFHRHPICIEERRLERLCETLILDWPPTD